MDYAILNNFQGKKFLKKDQALQLFILFENVTKAFKFYFLEMNGFRCTFETILNGSGFLKKV